LRQLELLPFLGPLERFLVGGKLFIDTRDLTLQQVSFVAKSPLPCFVNFYDLICYTGWLVLFLVALLTFFTLE
jgi:hypothetical protein